MYVTVETFAMQMRFIKQILLCDLVAELLVSGRKRRGMLNSDIVVTFDDGWFRQLYVRLPVLGNALLLLSLRDFSTESTVLAGQIAWLCRHAVLQNEENGRQASQRPPERIPWLAEWMSKAG